MPEPQQRPGRSRQDYGTPDVVLEAVQRLLRISAFALDAAASPDNAVASRYYTATEDGLTQPWHDTGVTWWNPPYGQCGRWTAKADAEAALGRVSVGLIPASVGSHWWRRFVHQRAHVKFLNGRVTFMGCVAPFPKDVALVIYGDPVRWPIGYDVWAWRDDVRG